MAVLNKFAPFGGRDFEYIESYLCDMARQGLLLTKYGLWFAEFEEYESINRRYRVVPKAKKSLNEEELALYEASGWVFLCKKSGTSLNIFYTDNEDAPEIFTDMESFRAYSKKYIIKGILIIIAALYLIYSTLFDTKAFFSDAGEIVDSVIDIGSISTLSFITVVFAFFIYAISITVSSIQSISKLIAVSDIKHNVFYERRLKFQRFIIKFIIIMSIVTIVLTNVYQFVNFNYSGNRYDKEYKGVHPVSVEMIDEDSWKRVQEVIDTGEYTDEQEDVYYLIDKTHNFLIESTIVYTIIDNVYFDSAYYEAKFESIASRKLVEEIYDSCNGLAPEDIAIDIKLPKDVDYAGYYINVWNNQVIFVKAGNKLERIEYSGDKDLRKYLEVIIDDVLN